MMKTPLLLALLLQISAVLAFQSAAVAVATTQTPSPFQQQQTTFFRQPTVEPTRKRLLASTIAVDSSVAEVSHINNPWDRVCETVQTSASQLNALRQKVQKSGVATALSYSLVSNVFTSVAVSLAWYGFSMRTGLSPVSPGQWKPFLAWLKISELQAQWFLF